MKNYPILFSSRDPIIGSGFVAGVEISGRCLMREEPEGFWIDGVNPGALSAGGQSRDEALLKFMQHYRSVLSNFATLFATFVEFEREVERFFWEETPGESEAWQRAVEEVRANRKTAGDWLPISEKYSDPSVKVVCLDEKALAPDANAEGQASLAAKAA